jgi:RNA polymerase sigma-70 factor (ECF subfamily)
MIRLPSARLTAVRDGPSVPEMSPSPAGALDAESKAWLRGLRAHDDEREAVLERLHDLLLRAARREAQRRRNLVRVGGVELDDICQQAADDALVAVISKLDAYRGASRFTTWAYKFVLLDISVKLRRHAWGSRAIPTSDDDPTWDRLAQGAGEADARLESLDLARALRKAVAEELTPRQREVFVAVVLNEVPGDVLAERLGSTRGAIYKTVYDARRKLRQHLEQGGYIDPTEQVRTGPA